ncbi:MAG TPA: DUF4382 domain-containing protein, partial [Steroidobacteraceae bacterium]|nr:DUF4382 domain-containing protein [Steroidobacteraceae bacterium]
MEPAARHTRIVAVILAAAGLGACSGTVSISLTDTPVDQATSVVVDFTGMELHNTTTGKTVTITFPSARQIDLLQLQNGATAALVQGATVPVGNYDWIQLEVLADKDTQGESYITLNTGAQYPLYIPSGFETGLRIVSPFKVTQSGGTQLLIEFNLRQSVTATDGQNYTLVPALRMVDPQQTGTISAGIDLAALAAQQLGASAKVSQC